MDEFQSAKETAFVVDKINNIIKEGIERTSNNTSLLNKEGPAKFTTPKEQVAVITQVPMHKSYLSSIPGSGSSIHSHSCCDNLLSGLLQHNVHGVPMKTTQDL